MNTGFDALSPDHLPILPQGSALTEHPALVGPSTAVERSVRHRVLHLINGEHYAGAERVQDLLSARLPQWGYEVGLACVKPGLFPKLRHHRRAPLYCVPMRWRLDLRAIHQLCQIVDHGGYELLHAHTPRTAIIGRLLARCRNLPLVYHVHSPTSRDSTRPWINRINAMSERLSLHRASRLIAVSQSLATHLEQQGFDPRRVTVVANGVPTPTEVPERSRPVAPWTLGTMALFRPRKGIEVLLDAMAILRQERLDVRLRAIGGFAEESYQQNLRQRTKRLGLESLVEWTGFHSDVNEQFRQLDLFVLPSLFGEGLPMVVLEAMAMGVPVVATDVEGVPEAIRDHREGRIVPAGDPAALAQAIAEIIQGSDWTTLRRNAMARQSTQFSDISMARGVADVYDQVLQPVGRAYQA